MSGIVTVETLVRLKRGFENLNYEPVEILHDEDLHSLFFSPCLGRIQLLKWCLSSVHDEMEQHLNTIDNNLEQEIVNQVVSFGFCPLGKQENIILGHHNIELQVILWETILNALTNLSQMEELNQPTIDKHTQFLENLTVNLNLKELLHTRIQILPTTVQSYHMPARKEGAQEEAIEMQFMLELKLNNIRQMKIDSTLWCPNTMGMEELQGSRKKVVAVNKKFCDVSEMSLKQLALQIEADKQVEWFDEATALVESNICRLIQLGSNKSSVMKRMGMEH